MLGESVSLSANGNTALVGGRRTAIRGAGWIFTSTGGFSDDPLIAGATSIRAAHVIEPDAHQRVAARYGLAPYVHNARSLPERAS
jgi:hypothetical protein